MDALGSIPTYIANTIYTAQSFSNPSVTVSTLQEFLDGEGCCCNFINQDLTFLQPSTIYQMTDADDSQSTASDSMDASILTLIENNQSQEVDSTPAFHYLRIL